MPGRRGQPGIGGNFAAVVEGPEKQLEPQDAGKLRPDALETKQDRSGRRHRHRTPARLCGLTYADENIALGLDGRDICNDGIKTRELTADLLLQPGRQRPPVASHQGVEMIAVLRPQRLEAGDPLARQQALDAVGVLDALFEQRLALAGQAPAILLFRAGRPDHRADPALAARPRHQRAQQRLDIEAIGLAPPLAPVDRDRGRIHNVALKAVGLKQAVQPETIEAGLLDHHHPDRPAQATLRFLTQLGE